MERKPYTLDRVVRLLIGVTFAVGFYFLIQKLSGVLLPFLIGWLIAYLIYPLVYFIQYKLKVRYRGLSIFIALLFGGGILFGLSLIIIPMIGREIDGIGTAFSNFSAMLANENFLSDSMRQQLNEWVGNINFADLLSTSNLETLIDRFLPQFWQLLSNTWQLLVGFFVIFLIILYVVFILIDYEKINRGFLLIFPKQYRYFVDELLNDLKFNMNRYFRGQALVAVIVGILYMIGFSIIGVPMAITMGLLIGVLHLIPYMQTVGFIPVVLLSLLKCAESGQSFWLMLLAVFIVFLIIQSLNDLFLIPKIMGKNLGLNPTVILLSLSIFGALLGFVGMIIALPITSLIIAYYTRFVLDKEKSTVIDTSL